MTEDRGATARVVLIEDNSSDAYLVQLALKGIPLHIELTHFTHPEKALSVLSSCEEEKLPELIILDLNTPRKSGFEVLSEIRTHPKLSATSVLVLTSSLSPQDKERAAELGVSRYVSKPISLDDFLATVGMAVQKAIVEARGKKKSDRHVG